MSAVHAVQARACPARATPSPPRPARRVHAGPVVAPVSSLSAIPAAPSVQPKCTECEAEDKLPVQPRLEVGPANDHYEREADTIAGQVMAMRDADVSAAAPGVQRACAGCETEQTVRRQMDATEADEEEPRPRRQMDATEADEEEPKPRRQMDATEADEEEPRPRRQMDATEADEEEPRPRRQMDATEADEEEPRPRRPAGTAAETGLTTSETELTSGGGRLPEATRKFYEPRMDRDLSRVRVHKGGQANSLNGSISARAFTYRDHIWLGSKESDAPSFTMAHELAHVMQQTAPGPVGPGAGPVMARPDARATPSSPRAQRFVAFWQPRGTLNSRKIHAGYGDKLQGDLVDVNNGLVTEVRIPGATKSRRYPKACGYADLYKSEAGSAKGTVPGLERTDEPPPAPPLREITYKGNCSKTWFFHNMRPKKNYTALHGHPDIASTDTKTGAQTLENCDLAPRKIWMGDVKPGHNENERRGAEAQVDRYGRGISDTAAFINGLHPTCWPSVKTTHLKGNQLKIPDHWLHTRRGDWTMPDLELRLSSGTSLGSRVFAPQKGPRGGTHRIKGRLSAVKDKKYTNGTWVYFVEPNSADLRKQLARSNPPPDFDKVSTRLGGVLGCLKSTPGNRKRLCRRPLPGSPGFNGTGSRVRRITPIVAGKTGKPILQRKKLPTKDEFKLSTWNAMRKGRAGATPTESLKTRLAKDIPQQMRKKIEFQGNAVEALDWMNQSMKISLPKPAGSEKLRKDKNTLEKAMFWSGETPIIDLAGIFGILRDRLGGLYIKGAQAYNKLRIRIRKAFKNAPFKAKGGSSIGRAAVKIVAKIFAKLGKVVLTKAGEIIFNCIESGFSQFLEKKVSGNLEQLVEKVAEVQKYVDKLIEDITGKITAKFEAFITRYKTEIDDLARSAKMVASIAGAIAEIVKIARLGFCASGLAAAGWGAIVTCILSIADWVAGKFDKSPLEWVIKEVMSSCRGRQLFAAALLSFDAIKTLPEKMAKGVLTEFKAVLPPAAKDIICDVDSLKVPKLSMADYSCQEGGDTKSGGGGGGGGVGGGRAGGGGAGGGTGAGGGRGAGGGGSGGGAGPQKADGGGAGGGTGAGGGRGAGGGGSGGGAGPHKADGGEGDEGGEGGGGVGGVGGGEREGKPARPPETGERKGEAAPKAPEPEPKSKAGAGKGAVGGAGKNRGWPVIFEEVGGKGFQVYAHSSVDNGSGSILLPDNPRAILHFKAPNDLTIVNSVTRAEEGKVKALGDGWYELISGPLHDQLLADLPEWIRQNRGAHWAKQVLGDRKRYPRRLFFRVTYSLEAIEGREVE